MSYFIVYENDKSTGLNYGYRYYVEHESEENIKNHPQPYANTIAEGVSIEEAINLVALTPEICLVASIIHNYGLLLKFGHVPQIEIEARFEIEAVRQRIATAKLTRVDASTHITHLRSFAKEDTSQAAVLRGWLARLSDEYTGQILTSM